MGLPDERLIELMDAAANAKQWQVALGLATALEGVNWPARPTPAELAGWDAAEAACFDADKAVEQHKLLHRTLIPQPA